MFTPSDNDTRCTSYRPFPDIHYFSDLRTRRENETYAYAVPAYTSGSDYSGNLANRSNHDVFCERFSDGESVWWQGIHGAHGSYGILLLCADVPAEAVEFFAKLENYPLADEDHNSQLETDAVDEAWARWVRSDFICALNVREDLGEDAGDKLSSDAAWVLFSAIADAVGEYWVNREGPSTHIDVNKIALAVTAEDLAKHATEK